MLAGSRTVAASRSDPTPFNDSGPLALAIPPNDGSALPRRFVCRPVRLSCEDVAVRAVLRLSLAETRNTPNTPLMGFIESPLHRYQSLASTPADANTDLGTLLPRSAHVPPLSFLPTTAVYSASDLAGLLRPATGHGVRYVSAYHRDGRNPRNDRPFEAFPFTAAVPCHHDRFPLAVGASQRCVAAACALPRPQGLAPL